MIDLCVVILTYNEEKHIARAIHSVAGLAREIFVVDSFSSDRTIAIAEGLGATILRHGFVNQARQLQWALDQAPIRASWILRLDADEYLRPELAGEIAQKLPQLPSDIVGVAFNRRQIFLGRWIRHGGRYPLPQLRLFRRGFGRVENRWMDEHIFVEGGATALFEHDFCDENLNGVGFFTAKHDAYATREAVEILSERYGFVAPGRDFSSSGVARRTARRRALKIGLYNRLPPLAAPLLYFLYRYVALRGFLDGPEGAIYHVLQGFWYRFLVGAKVVEFDRCLCALATSEARRRALKNLTGLDIEPAVRPPAPNYQPTPVAQTGGVSL